MKKKLSVLMAAAMTVGAVAPSIASADSSITKSGTEYMKRYSGSNRFQTAVDVSKSNFSANTRNLIIVNGMNPADALSGGPLAAKLDAPILLTDSYKITNDTLNEIARLNPSNVYILGGFNSVSSGVERLIKTKLKKDAKTVRISGANRYETSVKVAKEVVGTNTSAGAGFVNGATNKFPDALSAAALLGSKNMPLILTNGRSLPNGAEVYKLNGKNYIIGGTSSINIYGLSGKRLAGSERYATSAAVAYEGFKDKVLDYSKTENASRYNSCVIVDGRNYPDALTAISIAKKQDAPILLVNAGLPTPIANYINKERRDRGYIVGGLSSVNGSVQSALLSRFEENYKYNRNGESLKIRSAIQSLEGNMKKLDKYVALLNKVDANKNEMEAYKTVRDRAYNKYIRSGAQLGDATEEAIKASSKELTEAFEKLAKADDNQATNALANEIISALSRLAQSKTDNPSSSVKANQDEFSKMISDAKTLKDKTGKNTEKLEMAIKLKEFNLKKESATVVEDNKKTEEIVKESNELVQKADLLQSNNNYFRKETDKLRYAITTYNNDKTNENKEKLTAIKNNFQELYNEFNKYYLEKEQIDKILKDNEKVFKDNYFSENDLKEKSMKLDKKTLEDLKNTIDTEREKASNIETIRSQTEKYEIIIKNAEVKIDIFKELKTLENSYKNAKTFNTNKNINPEVIVSEGKAVAEKQKYREEFNKVKEAFNKYVELSIGNPEGYKNPDRISRSEITKIIEMRYSLENAQKELNEALNKN